MLARSPYPRDMAGADFTLEPNIKILLSDLGIAPSRVLRRAQLPVDLFAHRHIELSVSDYYRFWQAVDTEASTDGRRDLVVAIGQAISVEMFTPPIFAALCSPNLAAAAERIAKYKPLTGPMTLDVDTRDGVVITMRWPTNSHPPPLLTTIELIFWVALVRIATREHVRPERATVPHLDFDRVAIENFLGARLRAGAEYSVSFARVDATRPFLTQNDQMWRTFAPDLRRRLSELDASATVADRVRASLNEALPAGDPSVSGVSNQLGTTVRTLQRQLSDEGTTFQAILANTRENLARHYLARREVRTPEIAFLLGYSDTNSFYRAFKGWTGTTPDAVRESAPA